MRLCVYTDRRDKKVRARIFARYLSTVLSTFTLINSFNPQSNRVDIIIVRESISGFPFYNGKY